MINAMVRTRWIEHIRHLNILSAAWDVAKSSGMQLIGTDGCAA